MITPVGASIIANVVNVTLEYLNLSVIVYMIAKFNF